MGDKKKVGDLSVKYLKFLFLKTRKKEIPELEEDFRGRRYLKDDNEEDESEYEIIDTKPSESKILPELKNYVFHRLEEEDYKEQEVDNFIEKNTAKGSSRTSRRKPKVDKSKIDDFFDDDYDYEDDIDYLDDDFLEDIQPKKTSRRSSRSKSSSKKNDDIDDFINKINS